MERQGTSLRELLERRNSNQSEPKKVNFYFVEYNKEQDCFFFNLVMDIQNLKTRYQLYTAGWKPIGFITEPEYYDDPEIDKIFSYRSSKTTMRKFKEYFDRMIQNYFKEYEITSIRLLLESLDIKDRQRVISLFSQKDIERLGLSILK